MNNKNYSFILLVITLALLKCIRLSKQSNHYIGNINDDSKVIFNGDFDPSPKDLPESFINEIVKKTKTPKKSNHTSRLHLNKTIIDPFFNLNDTTKFFTNRNSSNIVCHDPTSFELATKYSIYLADKLHKINMMLIPAKTKKYHGLNSVAHFASITENLHTNLAKTYGSKLCSKLQVKMLNNTNPLCPWHYMEIERKDRYPFYRVNAVCNCKKCLSESSSSSGVCMPVKIPMPVLYRGKCNHQTGLYEWNNAIEEVSNACVCTN